jgi:hypothetical protein
MPSTVRVTGPHDLALEVHRAFLAAGVEAQLLTDAASSAALVAAAPGTVDVVCRTDARDATIVMMKRADPRRPVLAVGPLPRPALASIDQAWGPDAFVCWPATQAALVAGVARAVVVAPRAKHLRWPWVTRSATYAGLLICMVGGLPLGLGVAGAIAQAFGVFLAGSGSLLGATYSRSPLRSATFGAGCLLGAVALLARAAVVVL